jgi:hypothetical protein
MCMNVHSDNKVGKRNCSLNNLSDTKLGIVVLKWQIKGWFWGVRWYQRRITFNALYIEHAVQVVYLST